jgi:hypothetical protein
MNQHRLEHDPQVHDLIICIRLGSDNETVVDWLRDGDDYWIAPVVPALSPSGIFLNGGVQSRVPSLYVPRGHDVHDSVVH